MSIIVQMNTTASLRLPYSVENRAQGKMLTLEEDRVVYESKSFWFRQRRELRYEAIAEVIVQMVQGPPQSLGVPAHPVLHVNENKGGHHAANQAPIVFNLLFTNACQRAQLLSILKHKATKAVFSELANQYAVSEPVE